MAQTLYDKIWQDHLVNQKDDGSCLLYIDRHLVHEVTSPQAFAGLLLEGRRLWRGDSILATADHNVSTRTDLGADDEDPVSRKQIETLKKNCHDYHLPLYVPGDVRQGIVHVIGPEQGATLPGMTVVCGDSHTSTHGAFAALAMGIGTSEIETVLATQCLLIKKAGNMQVWVDGKFGMGITAKDLALAMIGRIGAAGGTGCVIEYDGPAVHALSMESRMTLCNMSVEAGARAGLIAFDSVTANYLEGRPMAPKGPLWKLAMATWENLVSDADAVFDRRVRIHADAIEPQVSWGTSPEMVVGVNGCVPDPDEESDPVKAEGMRHALDYMGLSPRTSIQDIKLDKVFIGSCTNARIEDLRAAARFVRGKKVADNVKQALVVPGSGLVKQQAERESLDKIFREAGFEWRNPGCSMCLAMNADRLEPGERCVSTSNRNFEGRQGQGGRTHLVSPAMAAAASIAGRFVDIRTLGIQ